jgi:hypothetical protein
MLTRSIFPILLLMFTNTIAGASCDEPMQRGCALYGRFSDKLEFESCLSQMQSYKFEVELYLRCMKEESERVLSDYNNAVSAFNRRTRR